MQRLMQLVLDLFDDTPRPPAAGGASTPNSDQKSASPCAGIDFVAPEVVANNPGPAETLPAVLAPAVFRHPQARREVRVGDAVVAYALTRARRRSIGLSVGPEGLAVRAPQWVTLAAVDAAVRDKGPWVLRKLQQMQERQRQQESARIAWQDGGVLPYLGEPVVLRLDGGSGARGVQLRRVPADVAASAPTAPLAELCLPLPRSATVQQVRDTVQAWLQRQARDHFTQRLDHFAPQLGVCWTRLRLSSAQTRWGSAQSDGSIRLNWRLLHYRPAIIDYVVAHELAHLRVMDHSPRFWSTVASVMPDHEALRRQLRDAPAPQWE